MTNERPEHVWAATLPNGLRVRVLCKPEMCIRDRLVRQGFKCHGIYPFRS